MLLLSILMILVNASLNPVTPRVAASANTVTIQAAGDLPLPAWWSGDCDTNNFRKHTGRDAVVLGGSYRGVKA